MFWSTNILARVWIFAMRSTKRAMVSWQRQGLQSIVFSKETNRIVQLKRSFPEIHQRFADYAALSGNNQF